MRGTGGIGWGAAFFAGVLAMTGGCRPGGYDYYDETDSILTVQEPGRDFSPYTTYGLWPEVFDLSGLVDDPIDVNHGVVDPVLLAAVQDNMDALGWTQVADPVADNPDVVAVIGVVGSDNWYVYSYYPWYGYYWWYYPYYPQYTAVNYPVGSVIVQLVKPDEQTVDANGDTLVPVIWAAAVWGQLSDATSTNLSRAEDGIGQAFDQSPYLER